MVIDTSAVVALFLNEPDAAAIQSALIQNPVRIMSAGTFLETSIVIEARLGLSGVGELDLLIHKASIEIVPVDLEQVELARAAYRRYGKGRHPAGLNFGDCFAYALCQVRAEPLLYKGDDFSRTDVLSVELNQ
ncbi:MAG: type II toxin-antitoxin system VapC family toxin [Deltaproteobacteria bacterium]|nr:type II toxin-antitoxin system VapC family toxin [Deltaproteobacteria bacterium]